MKNILTLALACLTATPMLAAPAKFQRFITAAKTSPAAITAQRLPDAKATELLAKLQARSLRPSVVSQRSKKGFVIPAAGSVPAGGGSLYFRSDVTLFNNDDDDQHVQILWLPAGGNAPQVFQLTNPLEGASAPITIVDFVGTVLNIQGLGALIFVPVDAQGNIDELSSLDGTSRIWTRQPGSTGTVSQPFPAVDAENLDDQPGAIILGLRQDAGFRTNYGLVNLDDRPHLFIGIVVGERGDAEFSLVVPAFGMVQAPIPAGDFGALTMIIVNDRDDTDPEYSWITYATSTDNTTGDGWVSIGGAALAAEDIPASN